MQQDRHFIRRVVDSISYSWCFSSWAARAWYLSGRVASVLGASRETVRDLTGRAGGLAIVRGYQFEIRCGSADIAILHPGHEQETDEWFQKRCEAHGREGVFVDVGAHSGSYSVINERGFERVIAVEPHPDNFKALLRNIELNNLNDRIEACQVAVGAQSILGRLFLATDDTHTLLPTKPAQDFIEVRQVTIDDLLSQCGIDSASVRVLKADIEGAEPDLIRGGRRLLTLGHPDLVLEANDEAAITTLSQMLSQYDYRLIRRLDGLNLLFQRN